MGHRWHSDGDGWGLRLPVVHSQGACRHHLVDGGILPRRVRVLHVHAGKQGARGALDHRDPAGRSRDLSRHLLLHLVGPAHSKTGRSTDDFCPRALRGAFFLFSPALNTKATKSVPTIGKIAV
jgi:hypothetical protein